MKPKTVQKLFHVTSPENMLSINENGIRSGDGMIFLFDAKECAEWIAMRQCSLKDFALYEINPAGITSELVEDKVAELTAKHQFYTKQPLIEPQHIRFVNCFTVDVKRLFTNLTHYRY